jgi:hypothetical protein
MGAGERARDWAQVHGTDGTDVWADYVPMCRKHHIAYDGSGHRMEHTEGARAKMRVSQKTAYEEGRSGLRLVNEARQRRARERG